MALALSTSSSSSRAFRCLSSPSHKERLFAGQLKPINLALPRHLPSRFILAFSLRRNDGRGIQSSSSSKKKKKSLPLEGDDDDDLEGDPFEALFKMLEEDLKNDDSGVDDDDDGDINEEDMDKLAHDLAEALGDADMEITSTAMDGIESDDDDDDDSQEEEEEEDEDDEEEEEEEEEDEDDEEEEREVKLKNWQLRKLAYALKKGRRKVSVKSLAAELCLDRAVVLEMLRDPPPNLLMMSAALPDEPPPTLLVPEVKVTETVEKTFHAVESKTKVEEPIHDRQRRWFAQKRLKKVQVRTLEMVYRRSKRPTNTMISSIVHVTNLPRQRIVKWFEDKRAEEGIPEHRQPYQRSHTETMISH